MPLEQPSRFLDERRRGARPGRSPLDSMEMGKVPPSAPDLEEAVLGAIMLEKEALALVEQILTPEAFYKEAHQKIYSAIRNLFNRDEPVDILSVRNELRKSGELELVGGAYYVAWLTQRVGSAANVEFHARVIQEKYIKRQIIELGGLMVQDGFDDTMDTFDLMDKAENIISEVGERNFRKSFTSIEKTGMESLKNLERLMNMENNTGITGIPSGFIEIDRITAGWQKTDLIILAARPAMGKTAFALNMLANAAIHHKVPTGIFSLEMSGAQLTDRLISSQSGIPGENIRVGKITPEQLTHIHAKTAQLLSSSIYIDDTAALSISEFRAKARKMHYTNGVQLIIVDYLQLMSAGSDHRGTREQEVSKISRSLKAVAKELGIPIIALSQMSRAVENRAKGEKRPQLSDLRESGAIEQDADLVMFLHRPEYYGEDTDEEGNSTAGMAEVIIRKHRNGSLGTARLDFDAPTATFSNRAYGYAPTPGNYQTPENESKNDVFAHLPKTDGSKDFDVF